MNFKIKRLIYVVLALIIVTGLIFGGIKFFKNKKPIANVQYILPKDIKVSDIKEFNKYEAEKNPKIPEYSLPLKMSEIANLKDIQSMISLSSDATNMLSKNGFVVVPNTKFKGIELNSIDDSSISSDFSEYYSFIFNKASDTVKYDDQGNASLPTKHLPMFITSDSVLHYFHLMFDTTLIKLETGSFYDYV
jgi:hypothetical protein